MIDTQITSTQDSAAPPAIAPAAIVNDTTPVQTPVATHAKPELRMCPLVQLYESPNNPRKRFSEPKLQELANSIRTQGVRVPLTVRDNPRTAVQKFAAQLGPVREQYEIIAGHRRYRACKIAGVEEVPILIHVLTDQQALEIMTIDNLQRDDVHPLEEADGFQALLDMRGPDGKQAHTVQTLSVAIGKSIEYIYARLKCRGLDVKVREAFLADQITSGHAILIARLPRVSDQREALKWCTQEGAGRGGVSVRQLAEEIERVFHHTIASAPFPAEKRDLISGAGPCSTCSKMTGSNPALYPGLKHDSCTDPGCWEAKSKAFVTLKVSELENKKAEPVVRLSEEYVWEKPKKEALAKRGVITSSEYQNYTTIDTKAPACPHVKVGVFEDGRNIGSTRRMCTNPRCAIHNPRGAAAARTSPAEDAKRKAELLKQRTSSETRKRTITAIVEAQKKPFDREDLELLAMFALSALYHEQQKEFCGLWGIETKGTGHGGDFHKRMGKHLQDATELELRKIIVICAAIGATYGGSDHESVADWAKRCKVDTAAIARQVTAELGKKEKPLQTNAKSKTAGGKR